MQVTSERTLPIAKKTAAHVTMSLFQELHHVTDEQDFKLEHLQSWLRPS